MERKGKAWAGWVDIIMELSQYALYRGTDGVIASRHYTCQ